MQEWMEGEARAQESQGGGSAAVQAGEDEVAPGEDVSAPLPVITHVQKYFILCLLHHGVGPSGAGPESSSLVSVLSPVALTAPVSG